MRFASRFLLLSASLATTLVNLHANNIPQVQHVIIVIQENRTPDNLFGSDAFANPHQLSGADLALTGKCGAQQISLQPIRMGDACNPNHGHGSWQTTYHGGSMDGACGINKLNCSLTNPEYTYVQPGDMQPYLKIAQQYGYANYFFQTNQGPSFPAHQFLFSGTSAPDFFNDTGNDCGSTDHHCWEWFAAGNANQKHVPYGCTATSTTVKDINPSGGEFNAYKNGTPCYDHNTLDSLLDAQSGPIGWKYYSQNRATGLWTAPNAISSICAPNGSTCNGADWINNVESVFPDQGAYPNSYSPILTNLGADPDPNQQHCSLPAVSWVVPDGNWSDHSGQDPRGAGPSWVSAIVNAVGGFDNAGNALPTHCGYWANTVVLIVWDDWGGWYDHVLPWRCDPGPNGVCHGYDQAEDGKQYVYGFRVPLIVVSAYNYRQQGSSGYISGACTAPGNCPNEKPPFIHDFGSILNFIEWVFGSGGQSLHFVGQPANSGISPSYPYADFYAPDGHVVYPPSPYSLSDFFDFGQSATTFTPFTSQAGVIYATKCFITPKDQSCFGPNFASADPDDDDVNLQQ